ncbi:histidinol-phosphate transaminase [Helicobacter sp. 11S02596-1]|uniref:pyridoxal phosphate-dependent aminotransferase n=1 Tax=Helicobacter sp. 11S02596-1 TaxID=1476194 RepID=UPI000BA64458|nr:histidinol-phosphate transaminase [Helicobacter sp. 11S02596-1]PAF42377.1 hypothetical protein BJI48_07140 [Helicobacter sp. 11S02596-1]
MFSKTQDFVQSRRDVLKTSAAAVWGSFVLGGLAINLDAKEKPMILANPAKKSSLVYLNSNENSLGMSPNAKQAVLDNLDNSFRYLTYAPDSARTKLAEMIGKKLGFKLENVLLGNGSSQVIQAAIYAFINQAKLNKKPIQLIVGDPTFEYAEFFAQPTKIKIVKVPLDKKMDLDILSMQKHAQNFKGISIVYICNPNNPTGTTANAQNIDKWVKKAKSNQTLFIFDEAYGEYATNFKSALEYVQAGHKNILVSKTFSKIYALAGLRVGYGIADGEMIKLIGGYFEGNKVITGFMEWDNMNYLGTYAALASLADKDFEAKSLEANKKSKEMLTQTLDDLKITYLPTQANFLFYKVKGDLSTYQKRMKEAGVVVGRAFPPLLEWNRVSMGVPEEMQVFVSALKDFRTKGWI